MKGGNVCSRADGVARTTYTFVLSWLVSGAYDCPVTLHGLEEKDALGEAKIWH